MNYEKEIFDEIPRIIFGFVYLKLGTNPLIMLLSDEAVDSKRAVGAWTLVKVHCKCLYYSWRNPRGSNWQPQKKKPVDNLKGGYLVSQGL